MARRTKEEAEKTRAEIVKTSLDLFCEKGYSKTTFDEIAKRINRTKGAVYWHFRNKPDLLIALIKDTVTQTHLAINQKVPCIKNINDLKEYFLYNAQLIKNNQELRKFMFFALYQMEWSENIFKKVKKSLEDIIDIPPKRIKETLTLAKKNGEISANTNIEEISEMFFCFWKGAVGKEIMNTNTFDSPDFIALVSKGFETIIGSLKEER